MKKQTIGVVLLALALAMLASSATFASDVRANVDERGIGFETDASYRALSVRIAGEGKVVNRVFEADTLAYISPADFDLPDGQYKYEAVLTPDNANLTRRASRNEGERAIDLRERNVLFGSFRIEGGNIIVDRGEVEPGQGALAPGNADRPGLVSTIEETTFATDVEVQGSLCVGQDCTTAESFGFDTIRLKENNLRIKFEDTSVGSFPSNDWQLTANDSSNGGASYLAIDDTTAGRQPFRVEAGARTNALYVESDGDVGFGTMNPVILLHAAEGDSPGLRLEQNGSSGCTPQTWDIVGNEANFFIRDVTNGSKLPFRIRPGAPESAIDIAANGRVGINNSAPQASMHMKATTTTVGTGNAALLIERAGGAIAVQLKDTDTGDFWNITMTDNADSLVFSRNGTGGNEMELDTSGNLVIRGNLTVQGAGGCTGCTP